MVDGPLRLSLDSSIKMRTKNMKNKFTFVEYFIFSIAGRATKTAKKTCFVLCFSLPLFLQHRFFAAQIYSQVKSSIKLWNQPDQAFVTSDAFSEGPLFRHISVVVHRVLEVVQRIPPFRTNGGLGTFGRLKHGHLKPSSPTP